jgi:hypothetical protein
MTDQKDRDMMGRVWIFLSDVFNKSLSLLHREGWGGTGDEARISLNEFSLNPSCRDNAVFRHKTS